MKNQILYYANVSLFPLVCILCFLKNFTRLTAQAFRWTVSEMEQAWKSNRRAFGLDD